MAAELRGQDGLTQFVLGELRIRGFSNLSGPDAPFPQGMPTSRESGQRRDWTDDEVLLLVRGKVRPSEEQLKILAQDLDSNVETVTKLLDR
jgi:hypothetical protein